MRKVYCTVHCNKAHSLDTGKPIEHECMDIPPPALRAELDGDYAEAIKLIKRAKVVKVVRLHVVPPPAPTSPRPPLNKGQRHPAFRVSNQLFALRKRP